MLDFGYLVLSRDSISGAVRVHGFSDSERVKFKKEHALVLKTFRWTDRDIEKRIADWLHDSGEESEFINDFVVGIFEIVEECVKRITNDIAERN